MSDLAVPKNRKLLCDVPVTFDEQMAKNEVRMHPDTWFKILGAIAFAEVIESNEASKTTPNV